MGKLIEIKNTIGFENYSASSNNVISSDQDIKYRFEDKIVYISSSNYAIKILNRSPTFQTNVFSFTQPSGTNATGSFIICDYENEKIHFFKSFASYNNYKYIFYCQELDIKNNTITNRADIFSNVSLTMSSTNYKMVGIDKQYLYLSFNNAKILSINLINNAQAYSSIAISGSNPKGVLAYNGRILLISMNNTNTSIYNNAYLYDVATGTITNIFSDYSNKVISAYGNLNKSKAYLLCRLDNYQLKMCYIDLETGNIKWFDIETLTSPSNLSVLYADETHIYFSGEIEKLITLYEENIVVSPSELTDGIDLENSKFEIVDIINDDILFTITHYMIINNPSIVIGLYNITTKNFRFSDSYLYKSSSDNTVYYLETICFFQFCLYDTSKYYSAFQRYIELT